jgi:hypothetical protein
VHTEVHTMSHALETRYGLANSIDVQWHATPTLPPYT